MSDYAIEVRDLRKKFCRSLKRSLLYGTMDVSRAMAGFPNRNSALRTSEFWALDGVSFALEPGGSLGLIGANGCGKSTLLRLLSGIFPPDEGEINIHGRMASLIAVGAGFHPHMSGAENIYLNGVLLGLNVSEIKQRFDQIVEFSEIGDFIEAPVSTYSSGMRVRLGFSIAVHTKPNILLVDEVMSVGDTRFRRKASQAMLNLLQNSNTTLILVSHNMEVVKEICEHSLLLSHGVPVFHGDTQKAYEKYDEITKSAGGEDVVTDFLGFRVESDGGADVIESNREFNVFFELHHEAVTTAEIPVTIVIADSSNRTVATVRSPTPIRIGQSNCVTVPPIPLTDGDFLVHCKIGNGLHGASHHRNHPVKVVDSSIDHWSGLCYPLLIRKTVT